jgi:hypothetical protein
MVRLFERQRELKKTVLTVLCLRVILQTVSRTCFGCYETLSVEVKLRIWNICLHTRNDCHISTLQLDFFFQCELPHSQTKVQYSITARAITGRHSNEGMIRKQTGFLLPVLRLAILQYSFHPTEGRLTTLQCHEVMNIAGSQTINTTLICITCSQSYQLLRTPYLLQCMSGIKGENIRFEGLTTVTMKSTFFCDIMPCSLVDVYRCFGWTYCHHPQGRRISRVSNNEVGKRNSVAFSLQANYTDRATAACRWSYCQLLRIEGVAWSAQRIPPRPVNNK